MRIMTESTGMARLAMPGRSPRDANQRFTSSSVSASTVMWPKAGRMFLWTTRLLVSTVRGFQ